MHLASFWPTEKRLIIGILRGHSNFDKSKDF